VLGAGRRSVLVSAARGAELPELANVSWRPVVDDAGLRRRGWRWTITTVGHVVPLVLVATGLVLLQPVLAPISAIAVALAVAIPAVYANRGAAVVRPRSVRARRLDAMLAREAAQRAGVGAVLAPGRGDPERVALGLLGDLVDHEARELHARTGLVLERGRLGVWLVAERGALLVRPGGRRVMCWCVRVPDAELPGPDRIAHLLLALRTDERGFATVANMAFSGAPWRVSARLPGTMRPALRAAIVAARARPPAAAASPAGT
jgi:hypothetical protein